MSINARQNPKTHGRAAGTFNEKNMCLLFNLANWDPCTKTISKSSINGLKRHLRWAKAQRFTYETAPVPAAVRTGQPRWRDHRVIRPKAK